MLSFSEFLKEYSVFMPKQKDTLGIERKDMPQVKSSDYDELIDFLKSNKINMVKKTVKANTLKAIQKDFNKDKIVAAVAKYDTLSKAKPLIVSADNYIIDGHHRWLGAHNVGGEVSIMQASVKVKELLATIRKFPKVFTKTIDEDVK